MIMAVYKVLFGKIYTIVTLLMMGLFFSELLLDLGDQKGSPLWNMSYIPYNDDIRHSYALPKDPKYAKITWHTTWVLLTVFSHRKSANFAIPRNTAKLAIVRLLKIKAFSYKGCDVMLSLHDATKIILSLNSNHL